MAIGDIVQGAVGGGLAGGSLGGPWGAIAGAGLGGLASYFGGNPAEENRKRMEEYYKQLGAAPQSGPAFQADYSGFRGNQSNLINQLEAMSQGRGPSLATEQLKAATDRNVSQQQALAQSGYGNATAAAMGAQNNSANLGAQAAQQAAQARIQEQMGALQQLGINIYGARNADEGVNQFNAGQSNQNQWRNLEGQLDTNRLRAMLLGQMQGSYGPSTGEQILAGGAGIANFKSSQNAANRGGQGQGY